MPATASPATAAVAATSGQVRREGTAGAPGPLRPDSESERRSSSTDFRSAIPCQRRDGSFRRQRRTTRSTSAGMDGAASAGGTGSAVRIADSVSSAVSCRNG